MDLLMDHVSRTAIQGDNSYLIAFNVQLKEYLLKRIVQWTY